MPADSQGKVADADAIQPRDIVWLDARHLIPTRGNVTHTWSHYAICLYHYYQNAALRDLIVSGTVFQFVCISSITKSQPFDPARQVRLDHDDPNTGLTRPSAACVDFAPSVLVTIEGQNHVLDGVRRLVDPVVRRVSPTHFHAVLNLFNHYWSEIARRRKQQNP